MPKKDAQVEEVKVHVPMPWDRGNEVVLEKVLMQGKPDLGTYESWEAAANRAVAVADQAQLEDVVLRFLTESGPMEVRAWMRYDKSGNPQRLAVNPLVEVEKHLNSRGYDTQYIGAGRYMVEKPDAIGGTKRKKGFPTAQQMLALTQLDNHDIDAELNKMWAAYIKKSPLREYILTPTIRGGSMGSKKEKEKAEKPTAKGAGGKDVELSPKKVEVLEAIEKGEKKGVPYGSGEDRLPDPESIAAMQLARDGVVHRVKIGTRWHYWKSESKAKAELAAAEKEAAKKPAKKEGKAASKAAKGAGKKKAGKLKKPSEK